MTEKTAAIITIKDGAIMTENGRKEIAKWMRYQAQVLLQDGENFSKQYRARYVYDNNDEEGLLNFG